MEASFTDIESGLEWIIHTHQKMLGTWDEVKAHPEQEGDTSWRMPTLMDAMTIFDHGETLTVKHIEFYNLTFWLDHKDSDREGIACYCVSTKTADKDIRRSTKHNKRNIVLVREIQ